MMKRVFREKEERKASAFGQKEKHERAQPIKILKCSSYVLIKKGQKIHIFMKEAKNLKFIFKFSKYTINVL